MRRALRLAALAVLALLLAATAGAANPLTGPRDEAPPAAADRAGPGPLAGLARWVVDTQRAFTRGMAGEMRAIGATPAALPAAIGLAFLYGMFHAVGPGHGKGVILGYFLSRRAGLRRGLVMGLRIAALHVLSAAALALLAKTVLDAALGRPTEGMLWLERVSYALVLAIGVGLCVAALRRLAGRRPDRPGRLSDQALPLGAAPAAGGIRFGAVADRRQEGLLALAVGVVPCSGALLVLVFAIGRDMLLVGLAMVAAIGIGMAATMVALAAIAIAGRERLLRRAASAWDGRAASRLAWGLELLGGGIVAAVGATLLAGSVGAL